MLCHINVYSDKTDDISQYVSLCNAKQCRNDLAVWENLLIQHIINDRRRVAGVGVKDHFSIPIINPMKSRVLKIAFLFAITCS